MAERRAAGYTNYVTARAMAPLLGYLRGLGSRRRRRRGAAVGAVEVLLADYREYLAVERGLTADTIEGYVLAVRPFLAGLGWRWRARPARADARRTSWRSWSRAARAQSRGAAKMTVTGAAVAAGVLALRGLIERPLAGAVPSTASWRLSGLPRALEPEQLDALLASCDRGTAHGPPRLRDPGDARAARAARRRGRRA